MVGEIDWVVVNVTVDKMVDTIVLAGSVDVTV